MRRFLLLTSAVVVSLGCGSSASPNPNPSPSPNPTPDPPLHQLWGTTFDAPAEARAAGAAEDAAGSTIVVGAFGQSLSVGETTLTSAGMDDVFVAKLDSVGHPAWGRAFGDGQTQSAVAVATDASGNIIVLGNFAGKVDFDGTTIDGHGAADDVFLAKLDPSGKALWAHGWGDAGIQDGYDVAVDGTGNIVHVGGTSGSVDFGSGVVDAMSSLDTYVSMVDATGKTAWARDLGGKGTTCARSIAFDPSGNVVVSGIFNGTFDFGTGPITSVDGQDIFVVKLDRSGNVLWTKGFGGVGDQSADSVAVDAAGAIYLTGFLAGPTDFGGGATPTGASLYLVKLDGSGAHVWTKAFVGDKNDSGRSVAADAAGHVLFAGSFKGAIDFGTGPLQHDANGLYGFDLFVASFGADGTLAWAKQGQSSGFGASHLALDSTGEVAVIGSAASAVDLGTPVGTDLANARPFVVKLGH